MQTATKRNMFKEYPTLSRKYMNLFSATQKMRKAQKDHAKNASIKRFNTRKSTEAKVDEILKEIQLIHDHFFNSLEQD